MSDLSELISRKWDEQSPGRMSNTMKFTFIARPLVYIFNCNRELNLWEVPQVVLMRRDKHRK